MRTKVFVYKNMLGIESSVEADGLINNPKAKGQLGFVVDASKVDISKEAIEFIKKLPRCYDDLNSLDIFKTKDGRIIFSWLGGPKKALNSKTEIRYNVDLTLLKAAPVVEVPEDFKQYVDNL